MSRNNSIERFLTANLAGELPEWSPVESKSGTTTLLFAPDYISENYRRLFQLPEDEKEVFHEAFRIVTEGVGNELSKINSVTSSSLLALLIFYRLFYNSDASKYITIPGVDSLKDYKFSRCFFEVRNKVIGFPSCVDVVLQDPDNKILLFLESKLTEYLDVDDKKTYGKSYCELYHSTIIYSALREHGIEVCENNGNLVLKSIGDKKYLEGIKQSISHLIGLYQGPQEKLSGWHANEYCDEYLNAFDNANLIYYGTILYKPRETYPEYSNYVRLYNGIIGKYGAEFMLAIEEWANTNGKMRRNKFFKHNRIDITKIKVLGHALSYQEVFDGDNNLNFINETVKKFYGF